MTTSDNLAGRESLFREVNENIASLTGLLTETDHQLFICECSNTACAESIDLTAAEYEAVRAHPTRFVVKPGHQLPGIERVVEGNGRFLVVEKIGRAADIVQTDDPRHTCVPSRSRSPQPPTRRLTLAPSLSSSTPTATAAHAA